MKVLGIETSCDETAAAVVEDGVKVLSGVVATSADEQALYGGIVPEIASRRHIESIGGVVTAALAKAGLAPEEIDAVAVTYTPGLIGALLVGVNYAKGLAYALQKPLVPVHHLRGHVASVFLTDPGVKPPFLCLVTSGGHCQLLHVQSYTEFTTLGRTVDDAAGEAFDKVARTLGLGYPGGPAVAKLALSGDATKYPLPTPKAAGEYDVSFSGLKTAVINIVNTANMKGEALDVPSLCASFQEKVAAMLTDRMMLAAQDTGEKTLCIAGGVAANDHLREKMAHAAKGIGRVFVAADKKLCGDNAEMIAAQGFYELAAGHTAGPALNACATMDVDAPVW